MNVLPKRAYRHLEINPITGSLGAEVHGVNLSEELHDEVLGEIRAALLDHLVIFFRNQNLSPARQLAFAKRWGEIHLHPFMQGMDDFPEMLEIKKLPTDKKNFGGGWHTDQQFSPKPAMGTILYGKQVPSYGGDTMFTNQYLAYEALSSSMKQVLDGLQAINSGDNFKSLGGKSRNQYFADAVSMKVKDPGDEQTTSVHPLVRTHPETGRKALYIGGHTQGIEGMSTSESQPLLDFLMRHSTKPEFTCRFRWQNGSLAFWDNRCTQHYAVDDYPGDTRIMHRITICGDAPF